MKARYASRLGVSREPPVRDAPAAPRPSSFANCETTRSCSSKISASDANEFLQHLIREGKVLASDIGRYLEIRKLEERLAALRGGTGRRRGRPPGGGNAQKAAGAAPAAGGRKRRKRRLTAKGLASRQLQGRYLGLIRQIPASRRGQYQKIAKESGREAAINAMKSAVNR